MKKIIKAILGLFARSNKGNQREPGTDKRISAITKEERQQYLRTRLPKGGVFCNPSDPMPYGKF